MKKANSVTLQLKPLFQNCRDAKSPALRPYLQSSDQVKSGERKIFFSFDSIKDWHPYRTVTVTQTAK
jgi:hypothetical protein